MNKLWCIKKIKKLRLIHINENFFHSIRYRINVKDVPFIIFIYHRWINLMCFFLCAKTVLEVVGFVKKIFVPNLIAQINRRNQPIFIFVKCYSKFKLFCNQKKTKKKTKMTNLTRNSKNNIGGRLFLHLRIGTIGIAPSRNCWKERPPPHIGKSRCKFYV